MKSHAPSRRPSAPPESFHPSPQRAEVRRILSGPRLQPKLEVGAPDDAYEREAERVASEVMRGPAPGVSAAPPGVQRCSCGGTCDDCREQEGKLQRAPTGGGPAPDEAPRSVREALRSRGRPLDEETRAFFEPRFGRDFGNVRVHTGPEAAASARDVSAWAYTVGSDLVFAPGKYAPGTPVGDRLLAHELTHVVQQGGAGEGGGAVRLRSEPRVAGDWIIRNPTRTVTSGGRTDAEILEGAFQTICGLADLNSAGDRIVFNAGPPNPAQAEGCRCLQDIESDLASPSSVLGATPEIEARPDSWSFTQLSPPSVVVRHPDSPLEWGYWTERQTRHIKPFWQTVAHEICGHVAATVRSGGAATGIRGVGAGHNPAIEGENVIATEQGVAARELRGMEMDPATGTPLPGHRGESFLRATVTGFSHASNFPPSSAAGIVTSVVDTVQTMQSSGMELFIQVGGSAYSDEGGVTMAQQRAWNVRTLIRDELRRRGISLTIPSGTGTVSRFGATLHRTARGTSAGAASRPGRLVYIYLYHNPASEGP